MTVDSLLATPGFLCCSERGTPCGHGRLFRLSGQRARPPIFADNFPRESVSGEFTPRHYHPFVYRASCHPFLSHPDPDVSCPALVDSGQPPELISLLRQPRLQAISTRFLRSRRRYLKRFQQHSTRWKSLSPCPAIPSIPVALETETVSGNCKATSRDAIDDCRPSCVCFLRGRSYSRGNKNAEER